jgi:hypothetical protein
MTQILLLFVGALMLTACGDMAKLTVEQDTADAGYFAAVLRVALAITCASR